MFRVLVAAVACVSPQPVKRWIYCRLLRWEVHPTARIGITYILVKELIIERDVSISHFNVIKGCDFVHLKEGAMIGAFNWVSGKAKHDGIGPALSDRRPQLLMGRGAGLTMRHLVDCSDSVTLDDLSVVAGFRTQIVTHGIDVARGCQTSAPVRIGPRSVVFTGATLVPGACVPARCVVAAGAVVVGTLPEELRLYGGVPAKELRKLPDDHRFFTRREGAVTPLR